MKRSVVLVGMMGAGKTSVGKKLASKLKLPFYDADAVIETKVQCSVADFFATRGEEAFRHEEEEVIAQLLEKAPSVISLGGGGYINPRTRERLLARAVTVWLKADLDVLLQRSLRRGKRPLLMTENPHETMKQILLSREAIYAEADLVIESDNRPVAITAARVQKALEDFLKVRSKES